MTAELDRICEAMGRDPASIGRSVGVIVEPGSDRTAEETGFGVPPSPVRSSRSPTPSRSDVGVTRVELHPWPRTIDVLEQLAPVFENLS